ncbi:MAG: hypothetical protein ACK5Z2_08890 [Bacteroidota bacterium]|jgi:hypothetical protein
MKHKSTFLFNAIFLIILPLSSCKKEEVANYHQLQYSNARLCTVEAITTCSGTVLSFPNQAAFDAAYNCLEQEYEAHNTNFEQQHSNLNDDDYNLLIDQIGFDEEQTLRDFENSVNFNSLRATLNAQELIWLNDTILDPATDPWNHVIDDPIYATLLSANGDVKIGNSIFHYEPDGTIIELTNGDCDELTLIHNNPNYRSGNTIALTLGPFNEPCKRVKSESDDREWLTTSSKMYKWRIGFFGRFFSADATVKIRNFKRNSNNRWRRMATSSYVEVSGSARNSSCTEIQAFSLKNKGFSRRKVLCAKRVIFQESKIQSQDVIGIFSAGSTVTSERLSW